MKFVMPWRSLAAAALGLGILGTSLAAVIGRPLHSFGGREGQTPSTPLVLASDGNWYGTTGIGGAHRRGTIFRVTPDGGFSVIHDFDLHSAGIGEDVASGLTEGPDHALYGSLSPRGIHHGGILYRVTTAGEFSVLHEFGGFDTREARVPMGPPTPGPDGNFYGAARDGGELGLGAVYRMTPQGEVAVIHSFDSKVAYDPNGTVAVSADGHVYGTTNYGPGFGYGSVYRMDLDGSNFTVVHGWPKTRKEGVFPTSVLLAPGGVIYGTTLGLESGPNGNYQGLVFKIDAGGAYSIVQGFRNDGRAGTQPVGGLSMGNDGSLYGATWAGGPHNGGSVFRITPEGQLRILAILGSSDFSPRQPSGGAALAPDGSLWLTTRLGGRHHDGERGTVMRVPPPAN